MTDLPPGWTAAPLEHMLDHTIGGIWGSEPGLEDETVAVIRVTEMAPDGRLDPSTAAERSISEGQLATRRLATDDLILEKSGGGPNRPVGRIGRVKSVDRPSVCSNFMQLLRPRPATVAPTYLEHYLRYFHLAGRTIPLQTASTNIRNLKTKDYLRSPIPLPPRVEQERIVAAIEEHLSSLDAAAAALNSATRRVGILEATAIETAMAGIGQETTLDSYAAPAGITDGPFGSKLKSSHYTDSGPRVIRLENIGRGRFIDEETHIPADYFEELRKHEAIGGDLVVASLVSDRLRACIVPATIGPAIVKADCIRVRPRSDVDPRFLNYALMRPSLGDFVAESVTGVGRSRLGLTNVRRIPVPMAAIDVQRRIADELDGQFDVAARLRAEIGLALARAASLRRSILAAAFSGRLAPQDPADEPASVLLERVRAEGAAASPTKRTRKAMSA